MAKHRGVYKRGNIWWIAFKNYDGQVVRKSTGSEKHAEAVSTRESEVRNVRDILAGKEPEKRLADYTFNQLADKYLDFVNGRQASATVKKYVIDSVFRPKIGERLLRTFTLQTAEQLQTDLLNSGLNEGGTDKYISILKAMFTKAAEWEMVSEAVTKKVHNVKMFNPEERLRFLTEKEIGTLLSVCASHLQPIVVTALHSGMRKGEILKLVWSQVDLEHGFILLAAKENKKANKAGTKSQRKREIPIDNTLRALLQSIPRHFIGEGESRELVPYVFHDPKTLKPYGDIKTAFHTALENAKIADFHFHDLRHSFASHYVMNGGNIKTLQEILGHSNIKQTMRYAHLSREHKREATSIMDKMPGAAVRKQEEISGETIARELTSQLLHNQAEREITVNG